MDYPQDFPAESRAKVEAAKIRAGRKFDSERSEASWRSEVEEHFRNYLLTPFLVFAKEACALGLWPVDKMDERCQEFLRRLTIDAYVEKGRAAELRDPINNWNGTILWEFKQEIKKTPQWHKYENILLKRAKGHRPDRADSVSPRASVQDFIARMTASGRRITRTDIWSVAGYGDPTEFERFQRGDTRTTESAKQVFKRVLAMQPEEFFRTLDQTVRLTSRQR
jgi:hypothetical protein